MGKKTKIDVTLETRDNLKAFKKTVKSHDPSCKTYDDLFRTLMSAYHENTARGRKIKKLEEQLRDIRQGISPSPIPPQEPTPESSKSPEVIAEAPMPIASASSQCTFYSEGDDGLVHCSKDYDRKGIVHRVTPEVCTQHWNRMQKRLEDNERLAKHFPCLRRFKGHDERFHCVTSKGKATPLEHGLKTCQACADRLTEEIVATKGITLVTRRYVTCGATEQIDKERGVMLFCKNKACPHQNTWISIEACQEAKCPLLKTMKVPLTD